MPTVPQTLPTITVTDQPTFDRLMAAFNNDPAEYKKWHRAALKAEVTQRELTKLRDDSTAAQTARANELSTFLDPSTAT